jgi:hypothetical protein
MDIIQQRQVWTIKKTASIILMGPMLTMMPIFPRLYQMMTKHRKHHLHSTGKKIIAIDIVTVINIPVIRMMIYAEDIDPNQDYI